PAPEIDRRVDADDLPTTFREEFRTPRWFGRRASERSELSALCEFSGSGRERLREDPGAIRIRSHSDVKRTQTSNSGLESLFLLSDPKLRSARAKCHLPFDCFATFMDRSASGRLESPRKRYGETPREILRQLH